jgi:hypothetical protein
MLLEVYYASVEVQRSTLCKEQQGIDWGEERHGIGSRFGDLTFVAYLAVRCEKGATGAGVKLAGLPCLGLQQPYSRGEVLNWWDRGSAVGDQYGSWTVTAWWWQKGGFNELFSKGFEFGLAFGMMGGGNWGNDGVVRIQ